MPEVKTGFFLLTSKFCPLGLSAPGLWLYNLLNNEKMYIKSVVEQILFKLATNDHSDEAFLLISNFGPNGLSAPAQGLCLIFFSSITADFNTQVSDTEPMVLWFCFASVYG